MAGMAGEIGTALRILEGAAEALGQRLAREPAWHALRQLDARETAGNPLAEVPPQAVRDRLVARLDAAVPDWRRHDGLMAAIAALRGAGFAPAAGEGPKPARAGPPSPKAEPARASGARGRSLAEALHAMQAPPPEKPQRRLPEVQPEARAALPAPLRARALPPPIPVSTPPPKSPASPPASKALPVIEPPARAARPAHESDDLPIAMARRVAALEAESEMLTRGTFRPAATPPDSPRTWMRAGEATRDDRPVARREEDDLARGLPGPLAMEEAEVEIVKTAAAPARDAADQADRPWHGDAADDGAYPFPSPIEEASVEIVRLDEAGRREGDHKGRR